MSAQAMLLLFDRSAGFGRRLWFLSVAAALMSAAPVCAQNASVAGRAGINETILVTDTRNDTGMDFLAISLKQALSSQLEQSPFFEIVAESRSRAILQSLGGVSEANLRAACSRLGGRALIGSSISSRGHQLEIALKARDCSSGALLARASGVARNSAQIMFQLASAASSLRAGLGEPPSSIRRFGTAAPLGTTSLKALDAYARGVSVQKEQGDAASVRLFEEAIRTDPNFPMPFVALSSASRNLRQTDQALRYATKAYRLRGRVGERARFRIEAAYHSATGDLEREVGTYRRWTRTYPGDFAAHNNLGDDYFGLGELSAALQEYEIAVRLVPTVAGYSNVMGAYLSLNRFADARRAFDEAAALKLDGRYVRQNMYWLAFVLRDPSQMKEQVRWASGKAGDEDVLLSLQSDTEAFYGRMTKARELTRMAVTLAMKGNANETAALWQVNAALREAELGNKSLATEDVQSALQLSSGRDIKMFAALALARIGEVSEAKSLLADLERTYPTATLMKLYWFPTIRAAIALSQGDSAQALNDLKAASRYELGSAGTTISYLYPAYLRGLAELANGRSSVAELEFRKLVDHPGIVINFVTGALVHLQLARAYARKGETTPAKASYNQFLDLWKDADPDLIILKQAQTENASIN